MNATGSKAMVLGVCAASHALIDALCAGILLTLWQGEAFTWPEAGVCFGLYNLLAFGAQPLLGWFVDWSGCPRAAALVGGALVAGAGVMFGSWALPAIVTAGLGNAIFHLGAGSICLQLTPGRATGPGIFVAPGDLGLFVGTYLGQAGHFTAWPFILALAALGVVLVRLPLPVAKGALPLPAREWKWAGFVLFLLLGCISVRSLVGFSVMMPWKSILGLALTTSLAVTLGKALGGVLADRFGWGRIAVGALALSAPLLAFGANSPLAAISGVLLFNLTMPVTLAGTASLMPGRPALAFGSTCLALIAGAWPVSQGSGSAMFSEPLVVFGLIVLSAAGLYMALQTMFSRLPACVPAVYESVSTA